MSVHSLQQDNACVDRFSCVSHYKLSLKLSHLSDMGRCFNRGDVGLNLPIVIWNAELYTLLTLSGRVMDYVTGRKNSPDPQQMF